MTFGFTECSALAAWIVFVFMRLGPAYKPHSNSMTMMWRHMAWRLLRLIMGALLVVTIFYFTHDSSTADSWQLITGFVLFVVHVVLLKMCYMMRRYSAVAVGFYAALVVATGAVLFVPMCVDPPAGSLWTVNVGCFAAYMALLIGKMIYKVYRRAYYARKETGELRRSLMQRDL